MSVAKRAPHGWLLVPVLACSLAVGCSDDDDLALVDSGVDGGNNDGGFGLDASVDATVSTGDGGLIADKVIYTPVSANGHDRFFGVAYDSEGNIYAAGTTAESTATGADYSFVVAKYSATGVLDTTFGTSGFAIKNVAPGGSAGTAASPVEVARAVVIQASGKVVVAGNAEHQVFAADAGVGPAANDADVFLVRFNANGQIDPSFGTDGVVRANLGDAVVIQPAPFADGGVPPLALSGADSVWSLGQTADGKLLIHSATIGLGANGIDGGVRTDSDFALARFSADGVLDTTFGAGGPTPGIVRTDFAKTNASVRAATVLPSGDIVGAGYSGSIILTGVLPNATNPVLYKVRADGTPDPTFGSKDPVPDVGVWHDFARPDHKGAEAYGAALQGDKFVTLGYGITPVTGKTTSDLVWLRFAGDGSPDLTFGTNGVTFQDVGGYAENGRALATLPDSRLIGVGRGTPVPADPQPLNPTDAPGDALISVLTENGLPDESFGKGGLRLYDFGGAGDHLWSVQVSPNKKQVAAVGIQTGTGAGANDNGAVVILSLP